MVVSNSSYNCTPFLHSLLTKGKIIVCRLGLDFKAVRALRPLPFMGFGFEPLSVRSLPKARQAPVLVSLASGR